MMASHLEWDKASAAVASANSILVVTHVNPDGDAIGSMMGLVTALRASGKSVDAAVDDGVPNYLRFIPHSETAYAKITTGKWDLMISTDASDEERTGMVGAYGRNHAKQVINLDHHVTNVLFGDIYLVDVEAVSASEIVYQWLVHMNLFGESRDVALPLLTGLVTDTLGFRTSNVKGKTLGIAQQLMQAGASLTEVTARTLDSKPFQVMKLWGEALQSVELVDQIVGSEDYSGKSQKS